MGKKNTNSRESKKGEEETSTVCLFTYLVEGIEGNVSKDLWMVMNNTTMSKVKAYQSQWFPGEEENRTIIVDKGVLYEGDKRLFTEEEFKSAFPEYIL